MKTRRFSPAVRFASGICLLAAVSGCSLLHRHRTAADAPVPPAREKTAHHATARGLELEVKISPDPVKLGEVREININLTVRNVSKSPVTLKFPTTQILEINLRDLVTGAVVSKWSTDRTFTDDSRIVTVNRGERLEYSEPITTRELKPGNVYNLEVYFVGYENELLVKKPVIPQP